MYRITINRGGIELGRITISDRDVMAENRYYAAPVVALALAFSRDWEIVTADGDVSTYQPEQGDYGYCNGYGMDAR
jgi:hypothetical protein